MATGNVMLYRMPSGIPGAVNRELTATEEPNVLDATSPPLNYGDMCKMGSNGRIQALAPGDTASAFYGFLVRPFPNQNANYGAQGFGAAAPVAGQQCTVLKSGYMTVLAQNTTQPAKGGQIFVRVNTPPTGGHIGGLEAVVDATPANTPAVPVPNSYWMGAPDANGNCELAYNI